MIGSDEPLNMGHVMAEYANMPLMVPQSDLMRWWDSGLINETSYIFLALNLEKAAQTEEHFDLTAFCERWELPADDNGKTKRPKRKTVMQVLDKLEDLGAGEIVHTAVQLKIDFNKL